MGSGLAVVCNVYGNPFTAVMSAGNSPARARMLESPGARVVLVPHWNLKIVDTYLAVTSQETENYRILLAEKEGLYVGFSAAANVCATRLTKLTSLTPLYEI